MERTSRDWQSEVKGLLKAELKRRDLSYADLADKLGEIGIHEDRRNISNKIGRGTFSAVFLVQCLKAIGARSVQFDTD